MEGSESGNYMVTEGNLRDRDFYYREPGLLEFVCDPFTVTVKIVEGQRLLQARITYGVITLDTGIDLWNGEVLDNLMDFIGA